MNDIFKKDVVNSTINSKLVDRTSKIIFEKQEIESLTENCDPVDSLNWKYSALQDAEYSDTVSVLQHEPTFFKHQTPYFEEVISQGLF